MHLEEVPVLPHAAEQVVEEVVEVVPQVVAHEDDVVAQRNLVLCQIAVNLVLNYALSVPNVLQALLDLLSQRCLEVQLIYAIQGHHWMQQMVCI